MKKILALLLCLIMAFLVVACDGNDSTQNDNEGNKNKESSVSFAVNYKSVKIELGADAGAVLSALGEAKSSSPMGNCGGLGTLTKYTYDSVEIYVLESDGKASIDQITLMDDAINTSEGVGIGSSLDEVLKACGDGHSKKTDTNITYTSGTKNLVFQFRDGSVVGIDYRMKSN